MRTTSSPKSRGCIGVQVGVATIATTWLQHNPAHDTVLRVFDQTGFATFLTQNPLDRATFLAAVRLAPTIKPGYYTVLSEPDAVERLERHVAEDPLWEGYLA